MTARTKFRGGGPGFGRLEMMRRRLDLTDEQVDTLRERLAEHRRQGLAILCEVLTDEQRAQFDAHLERRRQQFEGRFDGRGRGRRRHGFGPGGPGGWGGFGGWWDEAPEAGAPQPDEAPAEAPATEDPTDVA